MATMGGPTAFRAGHSDVTIINLSQHWADCHICGEPTVCAWGVPVWNGSVVANDWPGEWGGVPACRRCHDEHARGMHVEIPTSDYRPGACDAP